MEQILWAYGLSKEFITTTMMLYKDTKAMICSLDGDTDFFGIVIGVLQGDTVTSFLFIICLNYLQKMSIDFLRENSLTLTGADYAEDLALHANTSAQTLCLLHWLGANMNWYWQIDIHMEILSLSKKSCSFVSTTVWLHHINFNETHREKDRWELHRDVACCF